VAGVGYSTSVDDVDVETFDQQVKTNLHQVYYVIKNILGIRKTLNSIVTVSSVSSFGGSGSSVSYGAAKAGVIGLTKNLAYELAIHNIRVNTVIPGAIATPLFLKLTTSTERRLLENVTPSRRLGTPEDVASVIFFLLSSESNHITGQCITVDGGLSLAYKPYLT
jgi:3-oxoacyl-[acyl-carrier protein] reductase